MRAIFQLHLNYPQIYSIKKQKQKKHSDPGYFYFNWAACEFVIAKKHTNIQTVLHSETLS